MTHFSFGEYEWRKTGKGLLIAIAGSALVYISTEVLPMLEKTDSIYMFFLFPLFSGLVNAARLWLANNTEK